MCIVLDAVVSAGLSGSVIVVLILLLRLVLKNVPKRYICMLWLLAAVRLLVPLNIESSISLQPNTDQVLEQLQNVVPEQGMTGAVVQAPAVNIDGEMTNVEQQGNTSSGIPQYEVYAGGNWDDGGVFLNIMDWHDIKFRIWALVLCGFLGYTVISYGMLKRKVRNAVAVDEDVYECNAISSPFLLGYLQPNIYLPVGLIPENMEHILAHERAHIRRLDNWTKLFMFLCLAVHWFNPLVWVAYMLLCKDMEMACDEEVIRDMALEDRKSYSRALVNCAAHMGLVSACPVAFGEVSVKDRVLKVLSYRRPVFWISLVAVVAIVFVAVCFLTSPLTQEPLTGMEWLQSLAVEDVAAVRFAVGAHPLSYTDYAPEEFSEVLEFLQGCDAVPIEGSYLVNIGQQPRYYYVTMEDGTAHTLAHMGDHVEIDGIPYHECDEWLAQWPAEGRVQADMVQWALELLETERTRELFYMSTWTLSGETVPQQTWRRSGDNWCVFTDDHGKCTALLSYDGRQFRSDYEYIGPNYAITDSSWVEKAFGETFDLPWPLNEKQDPADYSYVRTDDFESQISVTLRYEPDGTLIQLQCWAGGWLSHYDLEYPDGTVVRSSFLDSNSFGTDYILQSHYLVATGQREEAFDTGIDRETAEELAERCRQALVEFQKADSYTLVETILSHGGSERKLLIWNSGDNWLRQYTEDVYTDTYLQYNGAQYQKHTSSYMVSPWAAADLSEDPDCRDIWVRDYPWEDAEIYCDHYIIEESETFCFLFLLDETTQEGYFDIGVTLDADGNLIRVNGAWNVMAENDSAFSTSYNVTVRYHAPEVVEAYIQDAYQEATAE